MIKKWYIYFNEMTSSSSHIEVLHMLSNYPTIWHSES